MGALLTELFPRAGVYYWLVYNSAKYTFTECCEYLITCKLKYIKFPFAQKCNYNNGN